MLLERTLRDWSGYRVTKLLKDGKTASFGELDLLSLSQRLRGDFMASYKSCQDREILKKVLKSPL